MYYITSKNFNIAALLTMFFFLSSCGLKGGDSVKSALKTTGDPNSTKPVESTSNQETNEVASLNYKAGLSLGGSPTTSGNVDGPGSKARFNSPSGNVAFDSQRNMYIADSGNNSIRKITPDGVVSTFAVGLNGIVALAMDSFGNIYSCSSSNKVIQKITPAGVVSTFAGSSGQSGNTDGAGSAARFNSPIEITIDSDNNLYVLDSGNKNIRKITAAGVVSTFASLDPTDNPNGLTLDSKKNLYFANKANHTIIKLNSSGEKSILAGSGSLDSVDGSGTSASFALPIKLASDKNDNIFVYQASPSKPTLRVIRNGKVTTISTSTYPTTGDSSSPIASLSIDASGNLYASNGHSIVKFENKPSTYEPYQSKVTLAGIGNSDCAHVDGTGLSARFCGPSGNLALDSNNNLYLADMGNHVIRKITPEGVVTTFAGTPMVSGSADGTGTAATFYKPSGVAQDSAGNFFVVDIVNHTIRKITPAGVVTTFAGMAGIAGDVDGTGSAARFNMYTSNNMLNHTLSSIVIDSNDNIYISDFGNDKIRKITPGAVVTTLASISVTQLSVDKEDNIYVGNSTNKIYKITPAGVVSTFAGSGTQGILDGPLLSANLTIATSIFDNLGNMIFLEHPFARNFGPNYLRIIENGVIKTIPNSPLLLAWSTGIGIDKSNNVYAIDRNSIVKYIK